MKKSEPIKLKIEEGSDNKPDPPKFNWKSFSLPKLGKVT